MRTWLWMETSSAETGSSQDDELGLERERPGHADPLPLAAGELVRVATGVVAPEAHGLQGVADALLALGAIAHALGEEALPDDVAHRHLRVEGAERVLEDDLHAAAHLPERLRVERGHVHAPEDDLAAGRLGQPDDRAAERRLPAARLADEAEAPRPCGSRS